MSVCQLIFDAKFSEQKEISIAEAFPVVGSMRVGEPWLSITSFLSSVASAMNLPSGLEDSDPQAM